MTDQQQHNCLRSSVDDILSQWSFHDDPPNIKTLDLIILALVHAGRPLIRKEIFMWIVQNVAPFRRLAFQAMWDEGEQAWSGPDFRDSVDWVCQDYYSPLGVIGPNLDIEVTRYTVSSVVGESTIKRLVGDTEDTEIEPQPFRFFDLPPELRKNVYEKVFDHTPGELQCGLYTTCMRVCPPATRFLAWDGVDDEMLSLGPMEKVLQPLLVCRQLYNESHEVFFRVNSFGFGSPSKLTLFFRGAPDCYLRHVKHVTIDYSYSFCQRPLPYAGLEIPTRMPSLSRVTVHISEAIIQSGLDGDRVDGGGSMRVSFKEGVEGLEWLRSLTQVESAGSPTLERLMNDEGARLNRSLRAKLDIFVARWTVDENLPGCITDLDLAVIAILYEDRPLTRKEVYKWIVNNIAYLRNLASEVLWNMSTDSGEMENSRWCLHEEFVLYNGPLRITSQKTRLEPEAAEYTVSRVLGEKVLDSCLYDESDVEQDQEPFRFLDLPPEIRKMVYELVFEHREGALCVLGPSPKYLTVMEKNMDEGSVRSLSDENMLRLPPVHVTLRPLLTNRQIYQEAHALFFQNNVWRFFDQHNMSIFLQKMPETYRRHVKHIDFRYLEILCPTLQPLDGLRIVFLLPSLTTLTIRMDEEDIQSVLDLRKPYCSKEQWVPLLPGILSLRRLRGMKEVTFVDCPILQSLIQEEMMMPGPRPGHHSSNAYEARDFVDIAYMAGISEDEREAYFLKRSEIKEQVQGR
ncbi:hypothetical protein LTR86_001178 [Recurvomyces mirabilis]|nr:hypothetical protein LTR86_001178 [Recurvomyces mirabilis]